MHPILGALLVVGHGAAVVAVLLAERRQPTATLAWLLALILLPGLGLLLYLLIGRTHSRRIAETSRGASQALAGLRERLRPYYLGPDDLARCDARTRSLVKLGQSLATLPASGRNAVEILVDGAATYDAMQAASESAADHLHVEFYIIQPDVAGRRLRDVLVERARAGVEVRVLYDAVGSMGLDAGFWTPLAAAGGRAAAFHPVLDVAAAFRRPERIDFRNHRKIVVADGHVGFTGGINVGREYLGLDPDHGEWRDTHARIAGPAVLSLQAAFAEDWLIATGELLEAPRYFPEPRTEGDCLVQIVDSGPDRTWSAISQIHTHAIALADERVWLTNPYFVPSQALEEALIAAALRGVDVRLLVPSRSDSRLVTWASASYFPRLIRAGVRVFAYERGFLHAKSMAVDSWVATIGSANLDMRSFHLNFELNAFVFGGRFADDLAARFEQDLGHAREVTAADVARQGYGRRILHAGARLFSPLL